MRTTVQIVAACVLVAGCVSDQAASDPSTESGGGKADGTGGSTLASHYALELTSKMKLEDTRESDPAKRYSTYNLRARTLVAATQTDTNVKLSVKICDVTLPQVSGYQPELDPAFVATLPRMTITGQWTDAGLATDPAALVLGAKLADPIANALPTDPSDPRVRDQDNDGNPGVSIHIQGYGSIFSALRVTLAISAPVTDPAAISGDADIHLDEAIYGDDIWFYDAASSFAESQQYVKVLSATNQFRMASGATTCAGVAATYP